MHVLVTRRLTMRPPALPDADDIAMHLSNPDVAHMLSAVSHPYWTRDAEEWIEDRNGRPDDLVYTIHRERLIGVVSLEGGGPTPRLGYWLGARWHGQGLMTEAARALLDHAFATRSIEAVVSSVYIDNPASLRVQEKLGFTVTGIIQTWCRARAATVPAWTTRLAAPGLAAASAPRARVAA